MPKIKTKKAAAKRIRVTGSGKIKRMHMFSGCKHIREKKSPKRQRAFRKIMIVHPGDTARLKRMCPYIF